MHFLKVVSLTLGCLLLCATLSPPVNARKVTDACPRRCSLRVYR